jgi:hypothetical protein
VAKHLVASRVKSRIPEMHVSNLDGDMSTRNIKVIMFLGNKVRRVRGADDLTAICEQIF